MLNRRRLFDRSRLTMRAWIELESSRSTEGAVDSGRDELDSKTISIALPMTNRFLGHTHH